MHKSGQFLELLLNMSGEAFLCPFQGRWAPISPLVIWTMAVSYLTTQLRTAVLYNVHETEEANCDYNAL